MKKIKIFIPFIPPLFLLFSVLVGNKNAMNVYIVLFFAGFISLGVSYVILTMNAINHAYKYPDFISAWTTQSKLLSFSKDKNDEKLFNKVKRGISLGRFIFAYFGVGIVCTILGAILSSFYTNNI